MAPNTGLALVIQRSEAAATSSVSKSASSGWIFATMAFLKPIFSKALFQPSTPRRMASRYFSGMLRSSQKVIGFTGSEISAAGSFFSRRQRLTKRRCGVRARSLEKSATLVVKWPTRGSARRGAIGCAGSSANA
jgi:hypothetical protein